MSALSFARQQQQPRVEMIPVSPVDASRILEKNTHNRRLSENQVKRFASDMTEGRWQNNGESIKIATDGTLLDGQHRLWAIVESETTQTMTVVWDLPAESQHTMDMGQTRSAGQMLALTGQKDSILRASVAHMLLRYQRVPGYVWGVANQMSKTEIIEYATEIADRLDQPVNMATEVGFLKAQKTAYATFCYLTLYRPEVFNPTPLVEFHHGILNGTGDPQDPRQAVLRFWAGRGRSNTGWDQQVNLGILIKAFNDVQAGRKRKTSVFRQNELPMPKIGD